ncbi:MAG: hypothetical protein DRH37_02380 [Deltaproteobacteria bacterium]|nr:MAG: hypothetical protein DRH37_02380 [Deltaproteobacteria bacterium]
MAELPPISLDGVHTYPLKNRLSKVRMDDFGSAWKSGGSFADWLESLPGILAADDFSSITTSMVRAAGSGKMIILAMGAHPIKVGLTPIIIDLMERGIIRGIAMNGAGVIHDTEIALVGSTSEDVGAVLEDGKFGMAEETGSLINRAISDGAARGDGLGRSVGTLLLKKRCPFNHLSLLARACELDVPATVHVAIGTDIIHFHPSADGAAIGATSHLDFRLFARLVSTLKQGVFINLGSAVIMPEVFLKALSLARNLGHDVSDFTTVNMDFIRHYRPMTNVVQRPTLESGRGFNLVGHHEIMFPLLAAAVIEGVNENTSASAGVWEKHDAYL